MAGVDDNLPGSLPNKFVEAQEERSPIKACEVLTEVLARLEEHPGKQPMVPALLDRLHDDLQKTLSQLVRENSLSPPSGKRLSRRLWLASLELRWKVFLRRLQQALSAQLQRLMRRFDDWAL